MPLIIFSLIDNRLADLYIPGCQEVNAKGGSEIAHAALPELLAFVIIFLKVEF